MHTDTLIQTHTPERDTYTQIHLRWYLTPLNVSWKHFLMHTDTHTHTSTQPLQRERHTDQFQVKSYSTEFIVKTLSCRHTHSYRHTLQRHTHKQINLRWNLTPLNSLWKHTLWNPTLLNSSWKLTLFSCIQTHTLMQAHTHSRETHAHTEQSYSTELPWKHSFSCIQAHTLIQAHNYSRETHTDQFQVKSYSTEFIVKTLSCIHTHSYRHTHSRHTQINLRWNLTPLNSLWNTLWNPTPLDSSWKHSFLMHTDTYTHTSIHTLQRDMHTHTDQSYSTELPWKHSFSCIQAHTLIQAHTPERHTHTHTDQSYSTELPWKHTLSHAYRHTHSFSCIRAHTLIQAHTHSRERDTHVHTK